MPPALPLLSFGLTAVASVVGMYYLIVYYHNGPADPDDSAIHKWVLCVGAMAGLFAFSLLQAMLHAAGLSAGVVTAFNVVIVQIEGAAILYASRKVGKTRKP